MKNIIIICSCVFLLIGTLLFQILRHDNPIIHDHFVTVGNFKLEAMGTPDENGKFQVIVENIEPSTPFSITLTSHEMSMDWFEEISRNRKGKVSSYTKIITMKAEEGFTIAHDSTFIDVASARNFFEIK